LIPSLMLAAYFLTALPATVRRTVFAVSAL
jgi:hypothetical protein